MGLAPNWCLEGPPPSLPALSLPHPPTPLGSFCNAPGRGGPIWCWGRGPRVQGGVEGRALQRYLGPDPHLGVLDRREGGFLRKVFLIRRTGVGRFVRKGVWSLLEEVGTVLQNPVEAPKELDSPQTTQSASP